MRRVCSLGLVLFGFLVVDSALGQEKKARIVEERDIVYGKGGELEIMLDVARPADGDGPFPCVVCIHGGGWRGGKRQDFAAITRLLAQHGFVAATVSYRLAPKHQFPAQIEDCKAAVRFLRAQAKKLRLDPDSIGALGGSAGGHLACLLGCADKDANLEGAGGNPNYSSRVQAVVSFFGPTDFTSKRWTKDAEDFFLVPFLGGSFEEKKEQYLRCSPISYVTRDDPPHLFFHGTKDTLVHIEHSERLAKRLQEEGVYARVVAMEGDGHGWGGKKLQQTTDQAISFLKDKLKR